MTTKFSPGDRVAFYHNGLRFTGTVYLPESAEGAMRIDLDRSSIPPETCETIVPDQVQWVHVRQCRRLKKKTRVVWESECRVGIGEGNGGVLRNVDDSSLSNVALSKFIGKRVRIEITEAKEKK